MDEEHFQEYAHFHETLYEACAMASRASGEKGVWSKFNPATLVYADRPDLGMIVTVGDDTFHAPKLSDGSELHAKERWLVETVQKEMAEGRRCVIYNNYTGAYGMNERVHDILTRHGIRCQILDEPNTDLRAERIAEYEEAGIPVLICNMKLVEVGLDLMFWPTIIYYQLNNEVSTVRQSSRRAWRIGQTRECRTYYVVYKDMVGDKPCSQLKQFIRLMSARGHALMVEGRLDKSELAEYSRDSQSSLASDLAMCLDTAQLSKAWASLAAKEMEGIEMIEEDSFQDVLKQRMKELANETLRLCGLDPEEWQARREAKSDLNEALMQQQHTYMDDSDDVDIDVPTIDLFEVFAQGKAEDLVPKVATEEELHGVEMIRLMTFSELITSSACKKKGKRVQPKKMHEDQLLFNFG